MQFFFFRSLIERCMQYLCIYKLTAGKKAPKNGFAFILYYFCFSKCLKIVVHMRKK